MINIPLDYILLKCNESGIKARTIPMNNHLHKIFCAVPARYDLVNRLITAGMDVSWRRAAVTECLSHAPGSILDICCGTGILTFELSRRAGDNCRISGLDFSQPMIEYASRKAQATGRRVYFITGDIEHLPFPDRSFDCVTIGFGFRNLTYRNALSTTYLSEILRVLRPGGRFVIVESSRPASGTCIALLHRLYVKHYVYHAGRLISGNCGAYRYLSSSILDFYRAEELRNLLLSAGFAAVTWRQLFFGAAALHTATKPEH